MRFFKSLIIFLFLFLLSEGYAQRAFNFGTNYNRCAGTTFSTSGFDFITTIPGLVVDGWYNSSGLKIAGGYSVSISIPASGTVTIYLRSSAGGVNYSDPLTITAIEKPRITVPPTQTVCEDAAVTLAVSSSNSVDFIEWADMTTGTTFSNGASTGPLKETTTYSVRAFNNSCDDVVRETLMVMVDKKPDTVGLGINPGPFHMRLCSGCPGNLDAYVEYLGNPDIINVLPIQWTKNGSPVSPDVAAPASGASADYYYATVSGQLLRTNMCEQRGVRINKTIMVEVSASTDADCSFVAKWNETGGTNLGGFACMDHLFYVKNPQPQGYKVTNISAVSAKGYEIDIQSSLSDEMVYFKYFPKDADNISITVTYTNECNESKTETYSTGLAFLLNADTYPQVDVSYCKGDTLQMEFYAIAKELYYDNIDFSGGASADFHYRGRNVIGGGTREIYYSYKDVVYDWNSSDNFIATVSYTYCDIPKTHTIFVEPHINYRYCYPEVEMKFQECKGDTNYISVHEERWPVAYIKSLKWMFPEGVQPFEEYDLDSFVGGRNYKLKIISYTGTPIGYEMVYSERGVDTTIIRNIANLTRVTCNPDVIIDRTGFCRGDFSTMNIVMNNKNGRLVSTNWKPANGRFEVDSLGASIIPYGAGSQYDYKVRFQKSGALNIDINYTAGDSVVTYKYGGPILNVNECRAVLTQSNMDNTYCEGDNIQFILTEGTFRTSNSTDSIISIRWEPTPSPVKFDSSSLTKYYYSHIAKQDTTFEVWVTAKDYFDSIIEYQAVNSPSTIYVKPYPKIWKYDAIDVCRENPVFLDTCWNTDMIRPNGIDWNIPPFYGDKTVKLREGDSSRAFIASAYPIYRCVGMAITDMVVDTISLVWNKAPRVEVQPFDPTCVNDTLELFATFDIVGKITWVKDDDTIAKNMQWGDVVQDVVTDAVWYTAINTTACGTISDKQFLTVLTAPPLSPRSDTTICLFDSIDLYLNPNPEVVGIPEWYVYDTVFKADAFKLYIRDSIPVSIIVMAEGKSGCKGKDTVTISALELPKVRVVLEGAASEDSMVCAKMDDFFELTAKAEGAMTYRWFLPIEFKDSTGTTITVPPTDTTTIFRVEGTNPNGCRGIGSFHVVVFKDDENLSSDSDCTDTACERSDYEFTATQIGDMVFYWQLLDQTVIQSKSLQIDSVTSADTGVYKLIRYQYGCYDTTEFSLRLAPTPLPKVIGITALCEHTSLTLVAESYPGATRFWRTPTNTIEDIDTMNIPQVSTADSGIYNFVIRLGECADSAIVPVRVDRRSSASIQYLTRSPDPYFCDGDAIKLAYLPSNGDLYILRSPSHEFDTTVQSNITLNNVDYQKDSGEFMLLVNRLTCQDTAYLPIDVRFRPKPKPAYDVQYCTKDTVHVTVTAEFPNIVYQWQGPNGFISSQKDITLNNVDTSDAGNYYLTAVLNGCMNYPDTAKIVVYPLPVVDFSSYEFLCLGDTLTVDMYRPDASYVWSTGETTSSIQVSNSGIYAITIMENNCVASNSVDIEGRIKPKFELRNDTMVCYGSEVRLNAGILGVNYLWSTGETGEDIYISEAGLYTLTTELRSCTWTDQMELFNRFCGTLEMPTAFRPESDIAENRIFKSVRQVPKDLLDYELFIYDKWGKLMFQTDDIEAGWDGTHNGKACEPGVYVYVIKAQETVNGNDLSTKGTVALVK